MARTSAKYNPKPVYTASGNFEGSEIQDGIFGGLIFWFRDLLGFFMEGLGNFFIPVS